MQCVFEDITGQKNIKIVPKAWKLLIPDILALGTFYLLFSNIHKNYIQEKMETFNDVISADAIVLVDFFATWCQPCKMMHPVLEQVKAVLGDKIRIIKIDVDKHGDIAGVYNIRSVPTLMLFRRNEVLYRQSGAMSKADLLSLLEPFLE